MSGSEHGERFNHDGDAEGYDGDVLREQHPIRDGYSACLDWVARQARVQETDRVVDVGVGTGNLTRLLPSCAELSGVDLSQRMLDLAREKLGDTIDLKRQDLLEWAHEDDPLDVMVSTYALHHLTAPEKALFLERVACRLRPGGRLVIGDLGFRNAEAEAAFQDEWAGADPWRLREAVEDEFFWDVDAGLDVLQGLGLPTSVERLGLLSWGISASAGERPA